MRVTSLLRASVQGAGVFLALTASLVLAFSIAITGPPTRSEMTLLRQTASAILRGVQVAAGGWRAEACVQVDVPCAPEPSPLSEPAPTAAVVASPPAPILATPTDPAPDVVAPDVVAPDSRSAELLGGADAPRTAPRRPPPRAAPTAEPRVERSERTTGRHARTGRQQSRTMRARAPSAQAPARLPAVTASRAENLPAYAEGALEEVHGGDAPAIREEQTSVEKDEALPWDERVDDDPYSNEQYEDDADARYESERSYYEDDDRHERRRYRRW